MAMCWVQKNSLVSRKWLIHYACHRYFKFPQFHSHKERFSSINDVLTIPLSSPDLLKLIGTNTPGKGCVLIPDFPLDVNIFTFTSVDTPDRRTNTGDCVIYRIKGQVKWQLLQIFYIH